MKMIMLLTVFFADLIFSSNHEQFAGFICIDMRSVKNIKVSMRGFTPEEISPHHAQTDEWISGYILIANPGISRLHLASLSLIH